MKLNHSLKFSTSKGPTLEEFTLGYIYAACEDLDKYPEFQHKEATLEDLSYLSVIMMRDEAERVFKEVEPQLKKAQSYNHINLSHLGHDLWLSSNDKATFYVSKLPNSIKDSILFLYNYHGNPSQLIKEDNNYILEFKDSKTQAEKIKFYSENYKSLTIDDSHSKKNNSPTGKPVEPGVPIITTIQRSAQDMTDLTDKLMNLPNNIEKNNPPKPKL